MLLIYLYPLFPQLLRDSLHSFAQYLAHCRGSWNTGWLTECFYACILEIRFLKLFFEVYDSVILSMFTRLYDYHHCLQTMFITPKKPCTHQQSLLFPPPSSPLQPLVCFVSLGLPVLDTSRKWIMQDAALCSWLLRLPGAAWIISASFLSMTWRSAVWTDHVLFIHLAAAGRLGCFHFELL